VKRRFIATASENAATFNAMTAQQQAAEILEKGQADERKDVRIVNDPATLAEYKARHPTGHPFRLRHRRLSRRPARGQILPLRHPRQRRGSYTNFLLLTRTKATVGGIETVMFDRTYNAKSLLANLDCRPTFPKLPTLR